MCHVFVRSDKLSVVCVSDHEYPTRVAHTMMQRVSEDFACQIDASQWAVESFKIQNFFQINFRRYRKGALGLRDSKCERIF